MIVCLSSISLSLFLAQNATDNTHHMLIVLAVFLPKGVRIVFLVDSIDTTDKIFGRTSFYLGNNNNTNKKCLSHTIINLADTNAADQTPQESSAAQTITPPRRARTPGSLSTRFVIARLKTEATWEE